MTRSINDLRAILDHESEGAPRNADRMAQVHRRILRRRRRRVTTGAALGVTAAALAVGGVYVLPGTGQEPTQALEAPHRPSHPGDGRPPPAAYQGMTRIAMKSFTETGKMMRVEFTPVGPDTAYIIQCRPGYEVIEQTDGDGGYGSFGDCESEPPESVDSSDLHPATLKEGERHVLEVVVLPKGTVKSNVIEYMDEGESATVGGSGQVSLTDYLASHRPGTSPWTVAVYSGTCAGDC
ncbi:hypothetical protein SMC26_13365 [Actinomadura fulvescens]|uniref:Uncharacterized protein n=1 Tax=Actinomadura fulvescens TaxID=46160 RepID=A0ABP6BUE5_9ACTN